MLNNEGSESIRGVNSRTKKPRTNGSVYVINFTLNASDFYVLLYLVFGILIAVCLCR